MQQTLWDSHYSIMPWVWHDALICVTWLVYVCNMSHVVNNIVLRLLHDSCAWHDSFMCVTWPIHVCGVTHSWVWHNSFISGDAFMCATCDMTHTPGDLVLETAARRAHVCDMTHSCVWHDSFMCMTWLIQICVTLGNEVLMRVTWLVCVTWLIPVHDVTHACVLCDSFIRMTCGHD